MSKKFIISLLVTGFLCMGVTAQVSAGNGRPLTAADCGLGFGDLYYGLCTGSVDGCAHFGLSKITCTGAADCYGTDGDDCIIGTGAGETIHGMGGDDVICAYGGNDIVKASFGHDIVCGGYQNDTLEGGWGDDDMNGGPGVDIVKGGQCNDDLYGGGQTNDSCKGGNGDDYLDCDIEDEGRQNSQTGGKCDR